MTERRAALRPRALRALAVALILAASGLPLSSARAATGAVPSAAVTSAVAAVPTSGVHWLTDVTPSPTPAQGPSQGPSAGGTEGAADTQGTECQGAQDPQTRVFGITAASKQGTQATPSPDQRTRYDYGTLKPGASVRDYVGFVNKSCFPVTLKIYPADAYNLADGSVDILPTGKKSKDIGSWVTIGGGSSITVAPRSTAIREFVLNVPRTAQPGDHLGAIIAAANSAPQKTTSGAQSGQVITEYRTGARFEVRVAGTLTPGLVIRNLTSSYEQGANPFWGGKATLRYTVENTGNQTLQAPQRLTVRGWFSGTTVIDSMPKVAELLPGGVATYTAVTPNLFPLDSVTARVGLNPLSMKGEQVVGLTTLSAETGFLALSWWLVLILVVIAVGVAAYVLRRRRTSGPRRPGATFPDEDEDDEDDVVIDLTDTRQGTVARAAAVPSPAPGRLPRTVRRILPAVGVLLLTVAPVALAAGPARADQVPTGKLTFLPAKGALDDPIWAITDGACPSEGTSVLGFVTGGEFKPDTVAIARTNNGVSTTGPFTEGVVDNFYGLANGNGVRLVPGTYTITMHCVSRIGITPYKTFVGTITFTDEKHYTAQAPAEPPETGVPLGVLSYSYPQNVEIQRMAIENGLTPPSGAALPSSSAAAAPPAPGAVASPGPNDTNAVGTVPVGGASAATSADGSPWLLVVGALAVVGLLAFLRSYSRQRTGGSIPRRGSTWDDEPLDTDPDDLDDLDSGGGDDEDEDDIVLENVRVDGPRG